MTERVYNFSAGPAVLPVPVLEQAQAEMLCLPGVGASVLEISHRSPAYDAIQSEAIGALTELLGIPESHQILFLQGGSRLQFSMVPMNLMRNREGGSDYIITGSWGSKALEEAQREGEVRIAFDGKPTNFDRAPELSDLKFGADSNYVHYTSNETIQGVQFAELLTSSDVPVVCDMSSEFLSRPFDVSGFGLVYACAQKNAGPAGVTVVIIDRELLARSDSSLPGYMNYSEHASANSLYNTPPSFGVYIVGLVAKWLRDEVGGLDRMSAINRDKAKLLYDVIDNSGGFYEGHAVPGSRSTMNVAFRMSSPDLEKQFLAEAADQQLTDLKGHRSVGGMRASIYNAMPVEGVQALAQFMIEFAESHG